MNENHGEKAFRFSRTVYAWLLLAYPRAHRQAYAVPMAQLFRDQCRDAWGQSGRWGLAKLWFRVLPDLVSTSILERLSALKERKSMTDKLANLNAFRTSPANTFFKVFVTVFLLVVIASVAITYILPESYASTARIKIEPSVPGAMVGATTSYDPYFLQTQFEIIGSQPVLGPVVEKLGLNERWGKKYNAGEMLKTSRAIEILKQRIDVRPVRNTSLVSITVYSDDRHEAAEIANAIVDSYESYLTTTWLAHWNETAGDMNAMTRLLQQEARSVQALQKQVKALQPADPASPLADVYASAQSNLAELASVVQTRSGPTSVTLSNAQAAGVQWPGQPRSLAVIETATPGQHPVKPNKPLNIILGAVIGIFIAAGVGGLCALLPILTRGRVGVGPAAA